MIDAAHTIYDDFEQALAELTTIVKNQRLKCKQQKIAHANLFTALLEE